MVFDRFVQADIDDREVYEKKSPIVDNLSEIFILIAVDTSFLLMDAILSCENCTLLRVETGADTIEISKNNPNLDLILMDIQMPKMNGFVATLQIREFNEDITIIAQNFLCIFR